MSEPTVDIIHPIPVVNVSEETPQRPQHSSWSVFQLAGTEAPLQILPRDANRHIAQLCVLTDSTNPDSTVRIGTMTQVMNGQGGILVQGMIVPIESQPAIWAVPTGDPITITVLDQRYE